MTFTIESQIKVNSSMTSIPESVRLITRVKPLHDFKSIDSYLEVSDAASQWNALHIWDVNKFWFENYFIF